MERSVYRERRIDPRLTGAGWTVTPFSEVWRKSHPPRLLWKSGLRPLAPRTTPCAMRERVRGVVEAKKVTVGPQGVLTQAERYSRGIVDGPLIRGEYGVPFLYSTNGAQIHFHDVRREQNRSRLVAAFHTPTALDEMLTRDADAEFAALARDGGP